MGVFHKDGFLFNEWNDWNLDWSVKIIPNWFVVVLQQILLMIFIYSALRYPANFIHPIWIISSFPLLICFPALHSDWIISLNLHSRVKIEDDSHGCCAKFSYCKISSKRGKLHYTECGCEFVLFAFLSLSLQDSMVNSLTVSLKQVVNTKAGMWNQWLRGGPWQRTVSGRNSIC